MAAQTPKQLSFAEIDAQLCAPGTVFEMVEVLENGHVQRVWKNAPPTFRAYLEPTFKKWADRVFVNEPVPEPADYDSRQEVTYGQMLENGYALAAWLRERGVGAGDRVAVGGINSSAWLTSFVGINLLGAVPVCLNSTLVLDAQIHCLALTKPKLVLVDGKDAQVLSPAVPQLKAKGCGPIFSWNNLSHVPAAEWANVTCLDLTKLPVKAETVADIKSAKGWNVTPTDDALVLFTSGTTSLPKGVMITQRQGMQHVHTAAIPAARAAMRMGAPVSMALETFAPPPEQQVVLMPVPLFHVTGLLAVTIRVIFGGGKLVFQRRWSVPDAVKLVLDQKVVMLAGVPSIATAILQSGLLPPDYQFAALSYGGAAPAKRLAKDAQSRFPAAFINHGWGMTEASGLHIAISAKDYIDRPEAVGVAIPIGAQRIVDPETRKPVPPNTLGVLHIRGGNLAKGYIDNPKANKEAYTDDGWFDTGDVGIIDDDGILYLRDRAKDMIIRGGENIASAEVENGVTQDPRIAECAAVPVPDDVLGERVAVGVSLAPGIKATPESIIEAAEPRLRYPARPVFVVIFDELPRNANGKTLKNEVKDIVQRKWKEAGGKAMGQAKARL